MAPLDNVYDPQLKSNVRVIHFTISSLLNWLIVVIQKEVKEVKRLKYFGTSHGGTRLATFTTDFDFDCRYQLVIQLWHTLRRVVIYGYHNANLKGAPQGCCACLGLGIGRIKVRKREAGRER